MAFTSLSFCNFRNIVDATIPVHSGQVFFMGENGQGKTNFLEAMYLACYGSSFRTKDEQLMIKHSFDEASVIANFHDELSNIEHILKIKIGKTKEIWIDNKKASDRKELLDIVPCIVFCHEDIDFVQGSPEQQRKFFNQTATLVYPEYVYSLRLYAKALKTRNLLLKNNQLDMIAVYDMELVKYGLEIQKHRKLIVEIFNNHFTPLYHQISGSIEGLQVHYHPSWKMDDQESILLSLEKRLDQDCRFQVTGTGPHRDKFMFEVDGRNFLNEASTGQKRLISLLLRLCQSVLVSTMTRRKSILLLDDVLLELDPEKRHRFINSLPDCEQAFFTFLPETDFSRFCKVDSSVFEVDKGTYLEKSR